MAYDNQQQQAAKHLYEQAGLTLPEVAKKTGIPQRTVRHWKREQGWAVDKVDALEARLQALHGQLLAIEAKGQWSKADAARHESLSATYETLLNRKQTHQERRETKAAPTPAAARPQGKRRKINDFSGLDLATLPQLKLYPHQQAVEDDPALFRFVLKARKIGMTYWAAWSALQRGLTLGIDQIFISATRQQVGQNRAFLRQFCKRFYDVEIGRGDTIEIINPAGQPVQFIFISTNIDSAQTYGGDLWIDEAAWIAHLDKLLEVAKAIAIQGDHRITILTTPSTTDHPAHALWAGVDDEGNPIEAEISRHCITLDKAIAQGFDQITWEKIKKFGYSEREIDYLFNCNWIDGAGGVFKLRDLQACWHRAPGVDESGSKALVLADLPAWKPEEGWPVYVGFDPNGGGSGGDSASIAALEARPTGLRLLEFKTFNNQSINAQAALVEAWCKKYQARGLGVDVTGVGAGVAELLEGLPKRLGRTLEIKKFSYDIQTKQDLVLHLERFIAGRRFEFDSAHKQVVAAFAAIKNSVTAGGKATIIAVRRKGVGHADLFWAIAHAAYFEPIEGSRMKKKKKPIGVYYGAKAAA